MKTRILIVILLCYTYHLISQAIEYPSFVGISPQWEYQFEEPLAHPDSLIDRYSGLENARLVLSDKQLILYSHSKKRNNLTGYTIVNIDPKTGIENCRANENYYTGLKNWLHFQEIELEGDVLSLYGSERSDTTDFVHVYFSWSEANNEKIRFKKIKIDLATCSVIEEAGGAESVIFDSKGYTPRGYSFLNNKQMETKLLLRPRVYYSSSYMMAELNDQLEVDSTQISYITHYNNNPDSFDIENKILYRGEDYFLSFVKQQNTMFHLDHPERAEIVRMNYSDLDSIHIDQVTDVTEITYDEFFGMINPLQWFYEQEESNDNLLVSRAYLRSAGSTGWIVWLDKRGNIKSNLEQVKVDGHEYYYFQKIRIRDDRCDMLAFPPSSGLKGFDVIRITPDGTVRKLGELVTELEESQMTVEVTAEQIGDMVYVAGRPTPYYQLMVYGIPSTELGLEDVTGLAEKEWHPTAEKVTCSPNPSRIKISLNVPETDSYIYEIYSTTATLAKRGELPKGSTEIDISNISTGMYYLRLRDEGGKIYTSEFVKQ